MPTNSSYEKLIWSIVHKITSKLNSNYCIEIENDLFQEGYVGLLEALNNFDKNVGVQFSTFAYRYIYGYCLNYLKKEKFLLCCENIDNSPSIDGNYYENDFFENFDLIQEINNRLKIINKKLTKEEENILQDKIYKDLSLTKCSEKNKCSRKKVSDVIEKYSEIIKDIIKNQGGN